jgi:hypothetical protein
MVTRLRQGYGGQAGTIFSAKTDPHQTGGGDSQLFFGAPPAIIPQKNVTVTTSSINC